MQAFKVPLQFGQFFFYLCDRLLDRCSNLIQQILPGGFVLCERIELIRLRDHRHQASFFVSIHKQFCLFVPLRDCEEVVTSEGGVFLF